ncbi:hypothetical protein D9613_002521 [Agrocybe pediades]|uniref:Uncharacterized protein n=1 Tax=Agrocybe pediades TaxID=84607 RepID=A0A8H4QQZ8_9AGAR|nr:hypothetical protein D9613_002521 [Agrocybe pediades]
MSALHQKPTSLDQKRNQNLANYPLSTRSTLSSSAAPRNLRLICDQLEAGNAGIQTHIRELSNAAAAITEGISVLKAQLIPPRRLDLLQASTGRMRACSVGNRISTTYTPTKAKKSSRASDEAEADNKPRKRRRLPLYAYDAHPKFRKRQDISTDSGSMSNNSDCRCDCRLSSFSSPASFPTIYSSKPNRHTSPQLKSPPPSEMAPEASYELVLYEVRLQTKALDLCSRLQSNETVEDNRRNGAEGSISALRDSSD